MVLPFLDWRTAYSRSAPVTGDRQPHALSPGESAAGSAVHDAVVVAAGAGAAGAGAVPGEHLRGGPAVQFHQVARSAASVKPGMAEVVPEPLRVHRDPGLLPSVRDELVDPRRGQRASSPRPPPHPAG